MGLFRLQKYSMLKKICKDFAKKDKNIIDIILFGSFARNKYKPEDIDIVILTHSHYDHNGNVDLFSDSKIYDFNNIDELDSVIDEDLL